MSSRFNGIGEIGGSGVTVVSGERNAETAAQDIMVVIVDIAIIAAATDVTRTDFGIRSLRSAPVR